MGEKNAVSEVCVLSGAVDRVLGFDAAPSIGWRVISSWSQWVNGEKSLRTHNDAHYQNALYKPHDRELPAFPKRDQRFQRREHVQEAARQSQP